MITNDRKIISEQNLMIKIHNTKVYYNQARYIHKKWLYKSVSDNNIGYDYNSKSNTKLSKSNFSL